MNVAEAAEKTRGEILVGSRCSRDARDQRRLCVGSALGCDGKQPGGRSLGHHAEAREHRGRSPAERIGGDRAGKRPAAGSGHWRSGPRKWDPDHLHSAAGF